MQEAWIQLECPSCGEVWEEDPSQLPAPDGEFQCDHCADERPMAEFTKTQRDLDVLKGFH